MWWQPIIGVVVGAILTYMIMRRLQKSEIKRGVRERRLLDVEEFVSEECAIALGYIDLQGRLAQTGQRIAEINDRIRERQDRGKEIRERVTERSHQMSELEEQARQASSAEQLDRLGDELLSLREQLQKDELEIKRHREEHKLDEEALENDGVQLGKYRERLAEAESYFTSLEYFKRKGKLAAGRGYDSELDGLMDAFSEASPKKIVEYAPLIRKRIDFLITRS
jgi:hypothetical protein